ncbi:MAG: hypothetical protein OWU84_04820 [Firmicutes bacterium]|nr:hypothetical protein [Bacillota bacterium]
MVQDLTNFASVSVGLALGLTLPVGLGVALFLIAAIQMVIREAELVIYVIEALLVALGQMNADGVVDKSRLPEPRPGRDDFGVQRLRGHDTRADRHAHAGVARATLFIGGL